MKVTNEIKVIEVDGMDSSERPVKRFPDNIINILSHWNYTDRIIIEIPSLEQSYTVYSSELKKAIQNAENHK